MVERRRFEYRRTLVADVPSGGAFAAPSAFACSALAAVLLDAYRGTIDDEGETLEDAVEFVDDALDRALDGVSFVAESAGAPIAFCIVTLVHDVHYIDPIVVAPTWKQQRIGTALVGTSLAELARSGVGEVGAVITEGNVASESLFASLGFELVGPWPPAPAAV